ncbi:MAG TPA: hypothetical protein VH062_21710 [Polyangiaceae bacterium]|jgi:hypothetical protein|nr:hypothetical protein [Polyangiaceae bacterium]
MKRRALSVVLGVAGALAVAGAMTACARERQSAPAAAEAPPAPSVPGATPGGAVTDDLARKGAAPSTELAPSPATSLPSSLRDEVNGMDAATAFRALTAASRSLDDTLGASAPDCATARILGDRICALASRLCHLADESPPDAELRAHCDDGKPRCGRARTRVASACN